MMGLGMMIGAGVFLGIGNSIFVAGPGGVILTFALNGIIALCTAMSYAELSSAIPRAGGAYNFARVGFGKGTSFLAGWMEWFASSIAGSMYAITFSIYLLRFLEKLELLRWVPPNLMGLAVKITAVLIAIFFLYINYRGASETGKIGAIMTLGQTLFLIVIGVAGVYIVFKDPSRLENFTPFLPLGWSPLLVTMGFTYVAFEGYEVIAQAGDEAIKPRQNLPKAMIYSVVIAALTYILVAFATVVSVKAGSEGVTTEPWRWIGSFRERGFGEAVSRILPLGNFLLTLAVIFASTSALNATVFSATRASYALGRDRMLPGFFAKISKKRKTPWMALIATGVIVLGVAAFLPTMDVASSASIMFLFLFFLVNICVIKIRLNMGDELTYGYLMPLFPVFPIVALVCQAVLAVWLIEMSLIAWIIAPCWIGAGLLIYRFYAKDHALPSDDEIQIIEEEEAPEGDEYRVMVAVSNPDNALSLVGNTIKLCQQKDSRIELLHMVPVPDPVSLTDGKAMLAGQEGIIEAMLYLSPRFPITTTIRYCRNIARGIISAVREKRIELLILGWHGMSRHHHFKFGSTIDPVLARTPSDTVILIECGNKKFKNILVPLMNTREDILALEAAVLLAEEDGKIFGIPLAGPSKRIQSGTLEEIEETKNRIGADFILLDSGHPDPVKTLLDRQEKFDLAVLGINRGSYLNYIRTHSDLDNLMQGWKGPLVITKTRGSKLSALTKQWF